MFESIQHQCINYVVMPFLNLIAQSSWQASFLCIQTIKNYWGAIWWTLLYWMKGHMQWLCNDVNNYIIQVREWLLIGKSPLKVYASFEVLW